jgi:OOP family OmpA-OmpF porin
MEQGVAALRSEPGYAVMGVKQDPGFGNWEMFCLKDALARPADVVLRMAGVNPQDFTIQISPYLSYQPTLVERRLVDKLEPPSTVTITLQDNGVLHMQGTASMNWILQARQTALTQPGIGAVDTSKLKDPRNARLMQMVKAVEGATILFPLGSASPNAKEMDKLSKTVTTLVDLERLAAQMGMDVELTIYGHADATGNDKRNYEISQQRAQTLASMLYSHGSSIPISLYGMGAEYADQTCQADGYETDRKIELRVHLTRTPETDFEMLQGQYE